MYCFDKGLLPWQKQLDTSQQVQQCTDTAKSADVKPGSSHITLIKEHNAMICFPIHARPAQQYYKLDYNAFMENGLHLIISISIIFIFIF